MIKKKQKLIIKNLNSIGYAHFGNGLTFWTTEKEENRDYKCIAHADIYRLITYYVELDSEVINYIQNIVDTYDETGSITGITKVFATNPKTKCQK